MQFPNPVPSAHHSTLFGVSCAHWSAIRTILHPTHRHTTHTTLIVKDIACIFWLWMLNFSNWCSNFLMSSTVINRQAPQIYLIAIVRHFFLSIIYFLFFSTLFSFRRKENYYNPFICTENGAARISTKCQNNWNECKRHDLTVRRPISMLNAIFGWLNFWFQFNIFE